METNQTFVVKEIGQPVRHSGPPIISSPQEFGEENHEFEASLGYMVTCVVDDAGTTVKLAADSGIPVEMQSRKNSQVALETWSRETSSVAGMRRILKSTSRESFGSDRCIHCLNCDADSLVKHFQFYQKVI